MRGIILVISNDIYFLFFCIICFLKFYACNTKLCFHFHFLCITDLNKIRSWIEFFWIWGCNLSWVKNKLFKNYLLFIFILILRVSNLASWLKQYFYLEALININLFKMRAICVVFFYFQNKQNLQRNFS